MYRSVSTKDGNVTSAPNVIRASWRDALAAMCDERRDDVAFVFDGEGGRHELTFGDWVRHSGEARRTLFQLGVRPGDTAAVMGPGAVAWPILQIAIAALGAAIVPLNPRWRQDELDFAFQKVRPAIVLMCADTQRTQGNESALDSIARGQWNDVPPVVGYFRRAYSGLEAPGHVLADDRNSVNEIELAISDVLKASEGPSGTDVDGRAAIIQFTSGTTAFPKAAMLSQSGTLGVAWNFGQRLGLTDRDRVFSTQPFHHVGGSVCTTLIPLLYGCCVVAPEHYTVADAFRLIRENQCTARYGQAAMYAMELTDPGFSPADHASVTKGWAVGGRELLDRIHQQMGIVHLVQLYGLSEATGVSSMGTWDDDLESRIGTCGKPFPGISLRIEPLADRPDTDTGEICLKGWGVMLGYLDDPENTKLAIDEGGWLHTGDIGRVDELGNLHYVDRLKDMIKPGGENVSPSEIERVLVMHPSVKQACVVALSDARLGEVPQAFIEIVPSKSLSERDVIDYCSSRIASYKVPRRVTFVSEWPMTASGKISKHKLKDAQGGDLSSLVGQSG